MSWFKKSNLNWIQTMGMKILKNGPIPRHVAFIMDGNRRWSKVNGVSRETGHRKCYELAPEVFQWCVAMGIEEVTFFALGVNNLKRSKEEVESLWDMTRERFQILIKQREQLKEWGVRVRVIGEFSKVPKDLQKLFAQAMLMTKDNDRTIFNFAAPYAGKLEITHAIEDILKGIEKREIFPDDISEDLISECLHTRHLTEPELIVRTSGVVRLSEFFLWQTTCSCFYFTEIFWPEYSVWDLMAAVFHYQRYHADIVAAREMRQSLISRNDDSRVMNFINDLHRRRECAMKKISLGLTVA